MREGEEAGRQGERGRQGGAWSLTADGVGFEGRMSGHGAEQEDILGELI